MKLSNSIFARKRIQKERDPFHLNLSSNRVGMTKAGKLKSGRPRKVHNLTSTA